MSWRRPSIGIYFLVVGAAVLGIGIAADIFAATYDDRPCGGKLKKFFLGLGVVYTVGGFFEMIAGLIMDLPSRTSKSARKSVGWCPMICVHCAGIPAFVFLVLGSLWVWKADDFCSQSSNPYRRAKLLLIASYGAVGASLCCNFVLLFSVGNMTKTMFNLKVPQE